MNKIKFLRLLPIIMAMILLSNSCVKDNYETNIYGNSILWISIDNSSIDYIESFEIQFTTKSVRGEIKNHSIMYTKSGGFVSEGPLSAPTTMQGGWIKVYENIDEADSIIVIYKGNRYTTRGYHFSEQRCIKVSLKTTSVGGEFETTDYDIDMIEQEIDVANLNLKDYEKSNLFYYNLFYYNICCNRTERL